MPEQKFTETRYKINSTCVPVGMGQNAARTTREHLARFLWTAVIFLAFIGFAVAARRTIVLLNLAATAPGRNPAASVDAHFASERILVLAHVLPAMLFMILGPLQFLRRLRSKHPRFHRWSGRIFLASSAVVGITGLRLALGKTIGGLDEKAAILLFGTFFLIALAKAFWHALRRQFAQHREWMIRGYAIGLAVAAIRPIVAMFFAAAVLQGHKPHPEQFFGTAFWIGFTLQMIAAEIWINHTREPAAADYGPNNSPAALAAMPAVRAPSQRMG